MFLVLQNKPKKPKQIEFRLVSVRTEKNLLFRGHPTSRSPLTNSHACPSLFPHVHRAGQTQSSTNSSSFVQYNIFLKYSMTPGPAPWTKHQTEQKALSTFLVRPNCPPRSICITQLLSHRLDRGRGVKEEEWGRGGGGEPADTLLVKKGMTTSTCRSKTPFF
jgi:hypothetical protein